MSDVKNIEGSVAPSHRMHGREANRLGYNLLKRNLAAVPATCLLVLGKGLEMQHSASGTQHSAPFCKAKRIAKLEFIQGGKQQRLLKPRQDRQCISGMGIVPIERKQETGVCTEHGALPGPLTLRTKPGGCGGREGFAGPVQAACRAVAPVHVGGTR